MSHHGALPISLFDYELPSELIAQHPLEDRASSRLLVLDRRTGEFEHRSFREIGQFLKQGDLLVMNDTRVLPARLITQRSTGGRVELLLIENIEAETWSAMARPARRLKLGETLTVLDDSEHQTRFQARVGDRLDDGTIEIELMSPSSEVLVEAGRVPLPHYITESLDDPDRYQTVYARRSGSIAAPTAGLHFTTEVLDELRDKGVEIAWVTLHVGPGTFQPVKGEDASKHVMHSERYEVSPETLQQVRDALEHGRRIIAVGTTSCRTLESIADQIDQPGPLAGDTRLYITPGYEFEVIDGLLTNFHLPRSTLLLLVSAFAGRESVLRAYRAAIQERYRFYSFGDAMLIV